MTRVVRSALLVLLASATLHAAAPSASARPAGRLVTTEGTSQLGDDVPVVEWSMVPDDFTAMTTVHRGDGTTFPADLSIDGTAYEGVQVQATGLASTDHAKKTLLFDLAAGQAIGDPYFDHPVSRITLNASFLNMSDLQEKLASEVFEAAGLPARSSFQVQLWRGDGASAQAFEGHYLLAETYDAAWREERGFDDGPLYADAAEQIAGGRSDGEALAVFSQDLQDLEGEALRAYIDDHIDVDAVIDYNAAAALANHQDWNFYYNVYQYRDGSGRWSYLPGDLSNAMVMPIFAGDEPTDLTPVDPLAMGGEAKQPLRLIENAMFQFPELRARYYERLRDLHAEVVASGQLDRRYRELYAASSATIELDLRRWQQDRQATYEQLFPGGPPFSFAADFPIDDAEGRFVAASLSAVEQDQIYRYGLTKFDERWAGWLEAPEFGSDLAVAASAADQGPRPEASDGDAGGSVGGSRTLVLGTLVVALLAWAVLSRGRVRR